MILAHMTIKCHWQDLTAMGINGITNDPTHKMVCPYNTYREIYTVMI